MQFGQQKKTTFLEELMSGKGEEVRNEGGGGPPVGRGVPGAGGLMGGGDSFSEAVAKQRQRQGRRQEARREQVSAKLKAHQAAEDAKMAQFRAILAQQQGGGGIPKRPQEQ